MLVLFVSFCDGNERKLFCDSNTYCSSRWFKAGDNVAEYILLSYFFSFFCIAIFINFEMKKKIDFFLRLALKETNWVSKIWKKKNKIKTLARSVMVIEKREGFNEFLSTRCSHRKCQTNYPFFFVFLVFLVFFLEGRPLPQVTWWHDNILLNSTSIEFTDKKVKNVLQLNRLERKDLHNSYVCQSSNNDVVPPITSSVTLDLNCKYTFVRNSNQKRVAKAREIFFVIIFH